MFVLQLVRHAEQGTKWVMREFSPDKEILDSSFSHPYTVSMVKPATFSYTTPASACSM